MTKWKWTESNPKGPASEPVELVRPDGTLAGVTLRTLENGWGAYLEPQRVDIEKRLIRLLNEAQTQTVESLRLALGVALDKLAAQYHDHPDDFDEINKTFMSEGHAVLDRTSGY